MGGLGGLGIGVDVEAAVPPVVARIQRVRVFIDFWNLQLSARDAVGSKFEPGWTKLPRWLATEAASAISGVRERELQFEGAAVYLSAAPGDAEAGLRGWANRFLDRVPGVEERRVVADPGKPCFLRSDVQGRSPSAT